ncbi:hypothetical protein BDF19DRAFT_479138 [Syncephalis fuscata]|nr:hypothetical protein BDF19DRAFT_479138 [Syncephalis fuscata]
MKSVLTIAAITLMLVSVAQAMFVNGILRVLTPKHQPLSMFKPLASTYYKSMDINEKDIRKLFTPHNIILKAKDLLSITYIILMERRVASSFGLHVDQNQIQRITPFKHTSDFGIVVPKEQFTISGGFGNAWLQDLDRITEIWRKIGTGLDYLKKKGWYTHMDIEETCLIGEKDNYKPYFVNFNNAIPVGKGLIEAENIITLF